MERYAVDEWVQEIGRSGIVSFYPTAASKVTNLPIGEVFKQLVALTHVGWLQLAFEVRCTECDSTFETAHVKDPTSLYGKEGECDMCGAEFEVSALNVFPLFLVDPAWKEHLKKGSAARGRQISSTGGIGTSLATLHESEEVSWAIFIVTPKQYQALQQISEEVPEVKEALEKLANLPSNKRERRDWLEILWKAGRAAEAWAQTVRHILPSAVVAAKSPEIIMSVAQVFLMCQ